MAFSLAELEWAINDVTLPNANGPNKIEPTAALKNTGFDWEQEPTAEEMNWMFFKIYKALEDLNSRTVTAGQLPVGSVYTNMSDSRNPAIILGYGTWTSKAGVAVIGAGTYTDSRGEEVVFTAGDIGGEYNTVLTIDQIPAHQHTLTLAGRGADNASGSGYWHDSGTSKSKTTSSVGGNQPHNNMMPYEVGYMWVRTA